MSDPTTSVHSLPWLTQRLFEIKPGIAERLIGDTRNQYERSRKHSKGENRNAEQVAHLVSQPEFLLAQFHTATETLGDAEPFFIEFAREFEADAAEAGAAGGVNLDAGCQFADDRPEMAGFEAASRCEGAAGFETSLVSLGARGREL